MTGVVDPRQRGPEEAGFTEIVRLIGASRERAMQAVNTALIELYWQIGEVISRRVAAAQWGKGTVDQLASYIARWEPGIRGFSRSNLLRMRQFYETYRDDQIVAPLVRQIPWSHHLQILGQCKLPEEREFYVRMTVQEGWSKRQLERQIRAALFERTALSQPKVAPVVREIHPEALSVFRDSYTLEFLGLPHAHTEAELHRGLLNSLREFLIEMGRDFCFIGSEVPLQVGNQDFALDLLFFHRGLNCLVAVELKVGRFEPEYLGKLNFYLEAVDRDVRRPHERPTLGLLLCASKDDEVVEYALSRSLSPAMIAEYKTQLPDKRMLAARLREFYLRQAGEDDGA